MLRFVFVIITGLGYAIIQIYTDSHMLRLTINLQKNNDMEKL